MDFEVGKAYYCRDGIVRRIEKIGGGWHNRVETRLLNSPRGQNRAGTSSVYSLQSSIICEVPEEYCSYDKVFQFVALMKLKRLLQLVLENDKQYDAREILIYQALAYAREAGLKAGFRTDSRNNPDGEGYYWPVACIDLPTGQVSWHMPGYDKEWDGHETPEKINHVFRFIQEDISGSNA